MTMYALRGAKKCACGDVYETQNGVAFKIVMPDEGLYQYDSVVMYAYGNLEDSHTCQEKCRAMANTYGIPFVVWDLPGYGHTKLDGCLSDEDVYAAALIVYATISARYARVYVWGRSLGTTSMIYLANQFACHGVILESPMSSLLHAAIWKIPFDYVACIDQFPSLHYAKGGFVGDPKVIILSMCDDEIVSPTDAFDFEYVLRESGSYVDHVRFPGKRHNGSLSIEEYSAAIPYDFFDAGKTEGDGNVGMGKTIMLR